MLLLDVSRTVARARHPQPSGIDRVERAYIDWALARDARFLCRSGREPYVLDGPAVRELLAWLDGHGAPPRLDWRARLSFRQVPKLRRARALVRRHGQRARPLAKPRGVYLNVGHDNLAATSMRQLAQDGWLRAVMVHDTIPLDHPDFTRPGTPGRFRRKLEAVALADLVLCNSNHTASRLSAHIPEIRADQLVIPLGLMPIDPVTPVDAPPAFVMLGTIEPRKNHAIMLDIWSAIWPSDGPKLHIIGRRGWQNAEVFGMLDTHPMMGRTVIEHGALSDVEIRAHLARAQALLFPSFAEGYGLPVAEALAMGVPVIASDLPALREVAGDVPVWLAPDDRDAWARTITAFSDRDGPDARSQRQRRTGWGAPTWADHFAVLEERLSNLLETNLVQPSADG